MEPKILTIKEIMTTNKKNAIGITNIIAIFPIGSWYAQYCYIIADFPNSSLTVKIEINYEKMRTE